MKKIIFLALVISSLHGLAKAQTAVSKKENLSSFETAMLNNIRQMDTAATASTFIALANNFERIGNAEKSKWQPFYYASYCYTAMAFMSPDKTKIDGLADKAETFLQQAEDIEKNNSEISCLFAMINSCRILVDPVSRFQTKGKEVQTLLAKAKEEDNNNPRIYLLQARMQLRTPEAFGGGKKIAKESIEKAIEKFKTFTPKNIVSPAWGEAQAKALLEKINTE
ncbi:MAG: hypothetical protein ABR503_14265, partial [Chitinophagaceae bacterium]